jgi:uncharacterized protein (TIGR02246 family)
VVCDEQGIRALHQRVLDGWNQGSGAAFAGPFSEDARFVGFDGSVFEGRREIADSHQELFDRWMKGSRLVGEGIDVTFVRDDVAVVHAAGGTIARRKSEPAPERDSIQTLVAVRDGETWSFVAFQNTRIRPIGANLPSALLWLLPDRLWRWLFRATKTVPRRKITFGSRGD